MITWDHFTYQLHCLFGMKDKIDIEQDIESAGLYIFPAPGSDWIMRQQRVDYKPGVPVETLQSWLG